MSGRTVIRSGSIFEEQIGYVRAVVTGDLVFVSGCTGYDYQTGTLPPNIIEQTEQCLRNVAKALEEAGASVDEIVRVRYILSRREDFLLIWPVLRRWFSSSSSSSSSSGDDGDKDNRPTATMFCAGLMNEDMRIEIEVTAVKGSGSSRKGERGCL
ncbi:endoribonuclease L-PSP [Poronia punctata]|nr:endoribonuclease L-PSP [Poronia punctata]